MKTIEVQRRCHVGLQMVSFRLVRHGKGCGICWCNTTYVNIVAKLYSRGTVKYKFLPSRKA